MAVHMSIDLEKLSQTINRLIPLMVIVFFLLGYQWSFYFHFATVFFIILTVVNFFYLRVQTKHTLLRNFGILGQGRYLLESVGPELRQYLFTSDTEERPFTRLERAEVYRKSKGIDSAISFGSQQDFNANEIKVRHSLFPLAKNQLKPYRLRIGSQRGLGEKCLELNKPWLISAMSFGALGENAVRALSRGAALSNIVMNTGEGGFPKYHLQEGAPLIFQMGTAKFGVRHEDGTLNDEKLRALAAEDRIKAIEIKFSQGAKPGKGGLLPKEKITKEISDLRGVPMGKDVESPSGHLECKDFETTVAFIEHVQEVSGLPVGIKLAVGHPEDVVALIAEMKAQDVFPDYIVVDGGEGGTGAAPKAFMDGFGMPLYPALRVVTDALTQAGVRERLYVLASGKLIDTHRQMIAFALGADAIYSARGFLLALGCIQALQCGKNTCPAGITTHDPKLQHGLDINEKAKRIVNYINGLAHDLEEALAATGCATVQELTIDHLHVPHDSNLAPSLHLDLPVITRAGA